MAIVWAIGELRHYLLGKPCVITTDHQSLCWLSNNKDASSRLHRWVLKLQEFTYKIKYAPGKHNYVADELSRNFDDSPADPDVVVEPTEEWINIVEHIPQLVTLHANEAERDASEELDGQVDNTADSDDEELIDRRPGRRKVLLTKTKYFPLSKKHTKDVGRGIVDRMRPRRHCVSISPFII